MKFEQSVFKVNMKVQIKKSLNLYNKVSTGAYSLKNIYNLSPFDSN